MRFRNHCRLKYALICCHFQFRQWQRAIAKKGACNEDACLGRALRDAKTGCWFPGPGDPWRQPIRGFQSEESRAGQIIAYTERICDVLSRCNKIVVVGCGPKANGVVDLIRMGYEVTGVEPIQEYVTLAGQRAGDPRRAVLGSAESLPFPSQSQAVVIMEHVLERVDSPRQSLAEIYRVLIPGGVAYIATSNRYHFSPIAYNGEFNVPFYNWFPDALKEAFVHHLHFKPSLANYTPRPAVHWFCYSDLCRVGRDAGLVLQQD